MNGGISYKEIICELLQPQRKKRGEGDRKLFKKHNGCISPKSGEMFGHPIP